MRNVNMTINGTILTITTDLALEGSVSSSGKSLVIGSTEGNVSIPGMPEVKIGLNIYKSAK
jgi:hypothetical protein